MKKKRKCKNCEFCSVGSFRPLNDGISCDNDRSEYFAEVVDAEFSCENFELKHNLTK